MGVKIIPEWSEKMIPKEKTNNEGKTETADPPRWKNNHIKAFSTSPKGMLIPSAVGQNKPETFTGSHRNKKKKTKTWTFGAAHGCPPPLCEFTAFREHIMVSWGSATAESEGNRISEHVVFHLCIFPCQLLTTV